MFSEMANRTWQMECEAAPGVGMSEEGGEIADFVSRREALGGQGGCEQEMGNLMCTNSSFKALGM